VHSAEGWEELLLPEIERQQRMGKEIAFRADAAFAKPKIYEALKESDVKYVIRIPANDSLERDIAEVLTRPVGRPSHQPVLWYKSFLYQAASWKTARWERSEGIERKVSAARKTAARKTRTAAPQNGKNEPYYRPVEGRRGVRCTSRKSESEIPVDWR
jgi:DDE family transposase